MTSYLVSTRDFLYRRRRPFVVVGTLLGGTFMIANYAISKLSEMQRKMVEERRDKDNLQRRFAQNQDDCSYTVLALLPTLGDQLCAYMDVEEITASLQKERQTTPLKEIELQGQNGHLHASNTNSQQSEKALEQVWNSLQENSSTKVKDEDEERVKKLSIDQLKKETSGLDAVAEPAPKPISPEARLAPSPSPSSPRIGVPQNGVSSSESFIPPTSNQSIESALADKREKLQLWNQLKITAISRTMTSVYGVVLLTLQTHIQLNLLGRYAYLTSVSSLSSTNDQSSHRIRLERNDGGDYDEVDEERSSYVEEGRSGNGVLADGIDVQTERLYLTLSWWFLHRGWKQLADIVQDAVQDVFNDVALKASLSHGEFISLLKKVRRRIEYESIGGFDGKSEFSEATTAATAGNRRGKRRDFCEILFPSTGNEVQVLIDAGAISPNASINLLESLSPLLPILLDETRDIIESEDFWRVFKLSLMQSFQVLEDTLRPLFALGPRSETGNESVQLDTVDKNLPPPIIIEQPGKSVRLASLFPAIARQSTAAIHGMPNEYVGAICSVKELRALCAIIYSSWS